MTVRARARVRVRARARVRQGFGIRVRVIGHRVCSFVRRLHSRNECSFCAFCLVPDVRSGEGVDRHVSDPWLLIGALAVTEARLVAKHIERVIVRAGRIAPEARDVEVLRGRIPGARDVAADIKV